MQQRNDYTTIEHFLSDPSFQDWVRFRHNHNEWEEWTLENQARAKLVEEARLWLLAMNVPKAETSSATTQVALQATWEKINQAEKTNRQKEKQRKSFRWLKIAASVAVVCGLLALVYQKFDSPKSTAINYNYLIEHNDEELVEETNNSAQSQLITLSDGSSILLKPNSKLSYPKIFAKNERKVYLSGEAFFEISKNPLKPFLVYANEVITKVYGTSFRINAFPNQPNVEVLVRTGKVKVSYNQNIQNADPKEIMLLPNQAARFNRQNLILEKITDITHDKPLLESITPIEQLSFEFTDMPVAQIFKTIEQAYLVKIDFPEERLKNCYLTTSLSDEPLPEKLKIICESLGLNTHYNMNGHQIIIISNGCN